MPSFVAYGVINESLNCWIARLCSLAYHVHIPHSWQTGSENMAATRYFDSVILILISYSTSNTLGVYLSLLGSFHFGIFTLAVLLFLFLSQKLNWQLPSFHRNVAPHFCPLPYPTVNARNVKLGRPVGSVKVRCGNKFRTPLWRT